MVEEQPGQVAGGECIGRDGHLSHRLLEADAGTGKTYTLTVHFLRLLASGFDPRRILATTFTRKAAGEILERILVRVAEAAVDPDAAAVLANDLSQTESGGSLDVSHFQAWLRQLVEVLPQLSVGTLDAFFRRLVAGFRYELGLVRMQQIAALGDPLVEGLRERAVRSTLERLATGEEPLGELTMRLYRGEAQRSVAWAVDRVFLELYQVYRESPEVEVWAQLEVPEGRLDESALEAAIGLWRAAWKDEALDNRRALESRLGKNQVKALFKSDEHLEARDWKIFLDAGFPMAIDAALLKGERECSYRRKPVSPEFFTLFEPLVRHARASLLADLLEQGLATHRLLATFHEEFLHIRKREGVVLFSDLADHIAHGLPALGLELQTALAYRLDGQVEHVLLDEFQDTSTVQWNALRLLIDEVLAWGDGSRTLFCVGDPKQSIYGWRGGRPELFDVVEQRLRPMLESGAASLEPLNLSYRSSQVVLDVVNRVFSTVSENKFLKGGTKDHGTREHAAKRWAERFPRHRCASPLEGTPGYVVLRTSRSWEGMFDAEEGEGEDSSHSTASEHDRPVSHLDFSAEKICEIVARRPGATIGVLTRSNRAVTETLFALRRAGQVASGEGHGRVVDDAVVTAVLSAFRLAASPSDTASLAHLASTPLGDLLDVSPELARVPQPPEALQASAALISRRVRFQILTRGACDTLADWCGSLAPRLALRSRVRLQQLLEVMLQQQELLDRSPRALVRYLSQVSVEEPAPAPVRVMTVHQAKGLQFDVVVLCELETQLGALYSPLVEVLRDEPLAAPSAVFRSSNKVTRMSVPRLEEAHAQELARRMRDDLSAVYVALTRARSELHLIVQPIAAPPGKRTPIERFSAAGFLRGALEDENLVERKKQADTILFESGAPLELGGQRDETPRVLPDRSKVENRASAETILGRDARMLGGRRSREGAKARRSHVPPVPIPSGGERPQVARVDIDVILGTQTCGVLRGLLLHAYFAEIEWLPSRGEAVADLVMEGINRRLAPGAERAWLDAVHRDFLGMLRVPVIAELFTRRPGDRVRCWRERAFALSSKGTGNRHGEVRRGVIDRVVWAENDAGHVVGAEVVDFKTGFATDRKAAYKQQLCLYREAVVGMAGLMESSVKARIAWLDRGVVEDV